MAPGKVNALESPEPMISWVWTVTAVRAWREILAEGVLETDLQWFSVTALHWEDGSEGF